MFQPIVEENQTKETTLYGSILGDIILSVLVMVLVTKQLKQIPMSNNS